MMAAQKMEFICKCFYTRNIFLQKYKLHVTYSNDDQFFQVHRQDLRMKGCATQQQYEIVLNEVKQEISRRKSFHQDALERYQSIAKIYQRLHPHLWDFNVSFLDDRFIKIVDSVRQIDNKDDAENIIIQNGGNLLGKYLYRVPVFTTEFCQSVVEELCHFEDSPCLKGRPNTMSNYGISLDEMGMSENLLIPVIANCIQPLSNVLFDHCCGETLDSFRAFSVLYGPGKDTELSMHFDNAEVTLNVCLTSQFEGGELEFGGFWDEPHVQIDKETVKHQIGTGVLHLGHHTHRALPIVSGTRCNLIIWMRSAAIRNKYCRMCGSKPDLMEVPFAGDGFTMSAEESRHCATL